MLDPAIGKSLIKVAVPLIAIAVAWGIARSRRFSLRDDIGLKSPNPLHAAAWIALYAALMLGSNALMDWRGPWDFAPWRAQTLSVCVLRLLAVGVVGPIAEEFLFRGLLFHVVSKTKLGAVGAVVLSALIWASIHYSYGADVIALLFVAGLLLGSARRQTHSLVTPVLMHVMWNLYAVW